MNSFRALLSSGGFLQRCCSVFDARLGFKQDRLVFNFNVMVVILLPRRTVKRAGQGPPRPRQRLRLTVRF